MARRLVWFPTIPAALVWFLIVANYVQLAIYRGEPLSTATLVVGHGLLVCQVISFILVQTTDPGSPTAEQNAQMERGLVPNAVRHEPSGLMVPERARFVRRHKGIVLHLDHFCWFLQSAIGLRNRKFFILFTAYSLALALLALAIDLGEIVPLYLRAMDTDNLLPGVNATGVSPSSYRDVVTQRQLALLFERAHASLGSRYLYSLAVSIPLNFLAAWFIGDLACRSFLLALGNRTWLEPDDARYDVGSVANLRAVLGDNPLLWLLPLPRTGSSGDGLVWPINAAFVGERPRAHDLEVDRASSIGMKDA